MRNGSTSPRVNKATHQAAKPYPDFPLTAHVTGRWAKKWQGKRYYFGPVDDWQGALEKFKRDWPYITQGKQPPPEDSDTGCTLRVLCNAFLNSKQRKVETGELASRTFYEYQKTTDSLIGHFGKERRVDDLQPADFEKYRAKLAKRYGVVGLHNAVNTCRVVFKYAFDNRLIDAPVNYGQAFDRPSAKALRKARNAAGPRMFEADELQRILDALDGKPVVGDESKSLKADPVLKAMVLLGVNCGFGNSDIASLPIAAVDFKAGWVDFPRVKTEIPRRVPLWPETLAALQAAIEARPKPATRDAAGLCFLTTRGHVRCCYVEHRFGRQLHHGGRDDRRPGPLRIEAQNG